MDLPQSKTNDSLLRLSDASKCPQIPPKPPYPAQFVKNGMSSNQKSLPTQGQPQLKSIVPTTSGSLLNPPPPPLVKAFSNCNNQSTESHKISTTSRRPSGISYIGQKYSRAVIEDPTTGCCLRTCCRSWMTILQLLIAFRAIITRFVFLALTVAQIITVVEAKGQEIYWMLCIFMLPLLADLCYSIGLVVAPRRFQDRSEKW